MAKQNAVPTVPNSWSRIEKWLATNAKSLSKCLAKGATSEQVTKLENAIGTTLPGAFKESLAIHDGQKQDGDMIPDDGIGSFYFLRSKDIVREWSDWNLVQEAGDFDDAKAKPDKGIAKCWWNRNWIPFASNGGDNLCIDLAPASSGNNGQIILVRHDENRRKVMSRSYGEWLGQLADKSEGGGIEYLLEE